MRWLKLWDMRRELKLSLFLVLADLILFSFTRSINVILITAFLSSVISSIIVLSKRILLHATDVERLMITLMITKRRVWLQQDSDRRGPNSFEVLTGTCCSPVNHYYNRAARSLRHVSIRPPTSAVSLGDPTKGWKSPWFSRVHFSEYAIPNP